MRSTVTMWGPAVRLASVPGQNELAHSDAARSRGTEKVNRLARRAIVNQVWAGHPRDLPIPINTFARDHVNQLTINPIIFYNMPKGWYFVSSTVSVAQWDAPGRDVWTVPVGGGIGRLFKIGSQAVNMRIQGMDNVHRPEYFPTWQLQLQFQLLFPVVHH